MVNKKYLRLLFISLAFVTGLLFYQISSETATAAEGQNIQPLAFNNLDNNLIKTTYMEAVGSGYMRVFPDGDNVGIEYYDSKFNLTEAGSIKKELPVWGGFYKGKNAYYLVEGRYNTECTDGTEVIRIIKYDTSWNRLGAGSIFAEDGWEYEIRYPFDVSCVNMTETGDTLYVVTGREGYVDPQYGQGHQGMMLIRMNANSFETEIVYGDFWHSFAQYIDSAGTDIYLYEQSEGSRCTMLSRFDGTRTGTDYFDAFSDSERFPVLEYGGEHTSAWSIPCYATVDDMALSSDNVLGIGTSIDQSQYDDYSWDTTAYNIYLTVTPLSNFSESATSVVWLTNNVNNGVSFKGVSLTKINANRFLVTWEESESEGACSDKADLMSGNSLHYVFIDGSGNPISDEYVQKAAFSDCHPRLCGSSVVFCSSTNSNVNFYSINASTGAFSKKVYRILGKSATWNLSNGVMTVSGSGALTGDNDWDAIGNSVKKIIIKGTITKVPVRAFIGIDGLTEVVIESGVKELGEEAFAFNQNLSKITIPASVTKIGQDLLWTGYYWVGDDSHVTYATIYAPGSSYAAKYAKNNDIYFKDTTPAKSIKTASVKTIPDKVCTGKAIKPLPVVKMGSTTLKNGTDYTLTYKNNTKIGKATVTIKGKGKYNNTITKTFRIIPKGTGAPKLASGKNIITVKWSRQKLQTPGYQIQYALNKSFTKGKGSVTVKSNKTTSIKIKKLKSKKIYYVRVRTFKKVSGTTYYSKWSATKSIKVK